MCRSRVKEGVRTHLENHKAIGFLINTGLDPMENHKDTETASNAGPPSACHQNTILIEFSWWVNDGPF